ncbi:hypothetical protein ACTMTI_01220 [Nonomuraea sp. H19]
MDGPLRKPEFEDTFEGDLRVSSLQTGVFSAAGSGSTDAAPRSGRSSPR